MAAPARLEWWGDDIESLRTFDLDTQRSGDAIERVTILPVRTEGLASVPVGAQHAALQRQSLLDLLPSDALLVLEQESAVGQDVARAGAEPAHHLEVARRLGEEPPAREALFVDPAAWRAQLVRFPRIALDPADADARFPIAPPEPVDRDIKRLRQVVATEPPTVILCDNEGQLERLEELLAGDRATLAVGALDGGFVLPGLRVLTDHEIFRRARRLRRPRRYREATATAAPPRHHNVAAAAGQDAGGDPPDGDRAARPVRPAAARGRIRVSSRHAVAARARVGLPVRGYARPAAGL